MTAHRAHHLTPAAALAACVALLASSFLPAAVARASEFLPPEQAFTYVTTVEGGELRVTWTAAPGYYLYRKRLDLVSGSPDVQLGTVRFPQGDIHEDEYFGKQEIYRRTFTIAAPIAVGGTLPAELPVELKLQGCADAGLCYPPLTWRTTVKTGGASALASTSRLLEAAGAAGGTGAASLAGPGRVSNADDFLPLDEAFRFEAVADGPDRVRLTWQIAPGYYLYRSRLAANTSATDARVGALALPRGEPKTDEFLGEQEVYRNALDARLSISRPPGGELQLPISVAYQGCAEAGLCYPPETKRVVLTLPASATGSSDDDATGATVGSGAGGFVSEQDRLALLIRDGNVALMLATFFGLGLLLAFTPCVLPMVPILSGIIAGHGHNVSTGRAFSLSLVYVLGMAFTNTLAGVAAAAAGQQIQALFQQPWIIALFAAFFVAMALSMFGAFTVQMPIALQTRLTDLSNKQRAGTFGGVAAMGALSALIVTACVAPPLFAALAVIAQTGDVWKGGAALFAMSLGMGAPLIAVGTSAGNLLPRAGAWMDTVKKFFGVLMLAVAAWMLARIVPDRVAVALWAVPALAAAWLLWTEIRPRSPGGWAIRGAGVAAGLYGVLLLTGAALGGTDPLRPLPMFATTEQKLPFRTIKTLDDLQREVANASAAGRGVMLDFYADWCVSCKEMEKYTFTDPAVRTALRDVVLLKADVTANDAADQALLKHFGIFGPPTIAFYGADGAERSNYRVVGFMKAEEFAQLSRQALAGTTLAAR